MAAHRFKEEECGTGTGTMWSGDGVEGGPRSEERRRVLTLSSAQKKEMVEEEYRIFCSFLLNTDPGYSCESSKEPPGGT